MTPPIHVLKTRPEYWVAADHGHKRVELRYNDRDFRVGDYLVLFLWTDAYNTDPRTLATKAGEVIVCRVLRIETGGPWLAPGYVAMSIQKLVGGVPDHVYQAIQLACGDFIRSEIAKTETREVEE